MPKPSIPTFIYIADTNSSTYPLAEHSTLDSAVNLGYWYAPLYSHFNISSSYKPEVKERHLVKALKLLRFCTDRKACILVKNSSSLQTIRPPITLSGAGPFCVSISTSASAFVSASVPSLSSALTSTSASISASTSGLAAASALASTLVLAFSSASLYFIVNSLPESSISKFSNSGTLPLVSNFKAPSNSPSE